MTDAWEHERVAATVARLQSKRVALQFPDELLAHSAAVAAHLRERCTGTEFFVLADTTFGSFDVDEVAAQHVNADLVVHYGRASLLRTARLPVLFVFGREPVDVDDCWAQFCALLGNDEAAPVVVLYDVMCAHAIDTWAERWRASGRFPRVLLSRVVSEWNVDGPAPAADVAESGRSIPLPPDEPCRMFYIGSESLTLTHLMMTHSRHPFFTYDPHTRVARRETLNVSRELMRRYYLVQRAKDADVIGIIVATLGTAGYLAVVDHVKRLIRETGKRAFTFVMGKLNVAKMANFLEVDVYVIVASPENSLVDHKDLPKPIVTPFELEIALARGREWTGEYLVDFGHLLPGLAVASAERGGDDDESAEPRFSLLSGSYKASAGQAAVSPADAAAGAVAVRNGATGVVLASDAAGDFLGRRTFRGLEERVGETPPALAVEGRRGVPRGYDGESAS